jgi:hypothetical protein
MSAPLKEPAPRAGRRTVDADGVVRIDRPRSRLALGIAAALVVAGGRAVLLLAVRGERADRPVPRPRDAPAASGARRPLRYAPSAAKTAEESSEAAGEGEPDGQREVFIDQMDRTGAPKEGIHAFNLPGTKPIQGGLLVPEGYVLPAGYVRHYQTTDDGEPVPPILKFHPDHRPVDASGNPIPLPADGIVPPELAPPDMPLQALDPPAVRRDLEQAPPPSP